MARNAITGKGASKIEGLTETLAALAKIKGKLTNDEANDGGQALKRVYMRAAFMLRNEARDLAPYDSARTHGEHLRDAIICTYGKGSKRNVLVTVDRRQSHAFHAWLVEYGHHIYSHQHRDTGFTAKAAPFMRPALSATRAIMLQTVAEGAAMVLSDLVEKYGYRIG
jgi:hypothetical protein